MCFCLEVCLYISKIRSEKIKAAKIYIPTFDSSGENDGEVGEIFSEVFVSFRRAKITNGVSID